MFLKAIRLALFLTLVFALDVRAADYYVDSENGSDASDGLSPAAAWQTLDAVNVTKFLPGDRVLFRRGGLWRGRLKLAFGDESARLVYSAYGEGEKPRLYGSVPLNDERDWIAQGDNLWVTRSDVIVEQPQRETPSFLSGFWSVHTENGASVEKTIDGKGTEASLKLFCKAPGTRTNHIQLINASFSIQRGVCYRLRFRAACDKPIEPLLIGISKAGSPWSGYGAIQKSDLALSAEPRELSVIFKANTTTDDARLAMMLGKNFPEKATLTLENFRVDEVKIDSTGFNSDVGNIILDGKTAAWKRWSKDELKNQGDFWFDIAGDRRLWFYSDEHPAKKYGSIEAANMRHIIDHSTSHDVTVESLDLRYGAAHGFGGTKAARMTIRDCDLSWIGGGDQYAQGGEGRKVRFGNAIEFWSDAADCLVENCRIWEVYDAALTNQGAGVNVERNITYRNNLIWNCEYSFEYWNRGDTSITEHILFEKNACFDAGKGWGHVQRPNKNGRHVMIYSNQARTSDFVVRDNIFCGTSDSLVRLDGCASNPDWPAKGLTLDGNRYFDAEGRDAAMWLGKNYSGADFDRFREAAGVEKNGVWGAPETTLETLLSR